MLHKLRPVLVFLLIALLAATPVMAALLPRAFSWWVPLLGLLALPLGDKDKPALWLWASVPLWAGTLSLISIIWAAYPDLQFEKAIDRLPLMYGLSIAVLGLGRLRDDIWGRAMPIMGLVFVASLIGAWLEYSFDFPLFHLYNQERQMTDIRGVIQAVMNRGLTFLSLLAIPTAWILWHNKRQRLAVFSLVFLTAGLAFTEASSTFVALLVAEIVFVMALFWPVFTRYTLMIGGAVKILCMPLIAAVIFPNMPAWQPLYNPSIAGRFEIWHGLSKLIWKEPVLGYGYEATRFIPLPINHWFFEFPVVLHPHNAALQFWMEYGVFGALLGCAVWVAWCHKSRSASAMAILALAAVVGFLSYGLWQGTWLGIVVFTLFYWRAAATSFGSKIQ